MSGEKPNGEKSNGEKPTCEKFNCARCESVFIESFPKSKQAKGCSTEVRLQPDNCQERDILYVLVDQAPRSTDAAGGTLYMQSFYGSKHDDSHWFLQSNAVFESEPKWFYNGAQVCDTCLDQLLEKKQFKKVHRP